MTKLRTEHSVLVSLNKCQENRRQQSLAPPLNFQSQELITITSRDLCSLRLSKERED